LPEGVVSSIFGYGLGAMSSVLALPIQPKIEDTTPFYLLRLTRSKTITATRINPSIPHPK